MISDIGSLNIDDIWVNAETLPNSNWVTIGINWSTHTEFGQYELLFKPTPDKILAYSECKDDDSKEFLKALFNKIIEKVEVKA